MEVSDSEQYNNHADNYQGKKQDSIINILLCGEILTNAKLQLSHGQWTNWLADPRVCESPRTATRLISIYNNYCHLLQDKYKKLNAISHLGVTHLLELQKLPERFRKEIEVVTINGDGNEEREMKSVVDETKVSNFLDTMVQVKGETKSIRDLPVSQMRKFINEASGVYEPELTDEDYDKKEVVNGENEDSNEASSDETGFDIVEEVLGELTLVSDTMTLLIKNADLIDETSLATANDKDKESIKEKITKVKDQFSTLYMRLEKLDGII